MKKYDNVIGIDGDVDKSGVAFLHVPTRKLEASTLTFPELLDYLQFVKKQSIEKNETVVVVVEAGWLNKKSNFHGGKGGIGQKIANGVGRNAEVGRKIIEMCKHYDLEVIEQRPLRKSWKGRGGKITHEELNKILKSRNMEIIKRSNQDVRDSVLIALLYGKI